MKRQIDQGKFFSPTSSIQTSIIFIKTPVQHNYMLNSFFEAESGNKLFHISSGNVQLLHQFYRFDLDNKDRLNRVFAHASWTEIFPSVENARRDFVTRHTYKLEHVFK